MNNVLGFLPVYDYQWVLVWLEGYALYHYHEFIFSHIIKFEPGPLTA